MEKHFKETTNDGYKKGIHEKMAQEYIRYVCEQALANKLRAVEVYLTRLPNGKYLTKEDVESYAKQNNYTIAGTISIDREIRGVKIYLSKIKTV